CFGNLLLQCPLRPDRRESPPDDPVHYRRQGHTCRHAEPPALPERRRDRDPQCFHFSPGYSILRPDFTIDLARRQTRITCPARSIGRSPATVDHGNAIIQMRLPHRQIPEYRELQRKEVLLVSQVEYAILSTHGIDSKPLAEKLQAGDHRCQGIPPNTDKTVRK